MFNPLSVPTEAEQVATQGAKSSYYGNLINAGVVSPEEVRQALRQDENSGFTDIAEDLPEDTGGNMGGMPGNENGGQPPSGNSGGGKEEGQPIGKDHQIIFNHGQFHKYAISEEELKKYNRPVPKPEAKAQDSADKESNENWKMLYPHGKSSKGQRVKLNEEKEIEAGLGGEHNGETLQELVEGNGKPEEKKEEERREAEKENKNDGEKATSKIKENSTTSVPQQSTKQNGNVIIATSKKNGSGFSFRKPTSIKNLSPEKAAQLASINNIDISKDNFLEPLDKSIANLLGVSNKKIKLRKFVFLKNKNAHSDIIFKDLKRCLWECIYNTDVIIDEKNKSNYRHFIAHINGMHYITLMKISKNSDMGIIIHCHKMNDKNFAKFLKKHGGKEYKIKKNH